MLGRVLPTGGAGIGDAKRIAAVSPSRFGFIQGTRNAMSRSLKRCFQLPWGPFFHPPGLPLASWIPMNMMILWWSCAPPPRPVSCYCCGPAQARPTGEGKLEKGNGSCSEGLIRSHHPVQRLKPSTGAGVHAPCSGFGVLGTDDPGLSG